MYHTAYPMVYDPTTLSCTASPVHYYLRYHSVITYSRTLGPIDPHVLYTVYHSILSNRLMLAVKDLACVTTVEWY